jgi:hypothetical protein
MPAVVLSAVDGGLHATSEDTEYSLAFCRDDLVLATDQDGQRMRADFVRGPDGRVAWFCDSGRLLAYQGRGAAVPFRAH